MRNGNGRTGPLSITGSTRVFGSAHTAVVVAEVGLVGDGLGDTRSGAATVEIDGGGLGDTGSAMAEVGLSGGRLGGIRSGVTPTTTVCPEDPCSAGFLL